MKLQKINLNIKEEAHKLYDEIKLILNDHIESKNSIKENSPEKQEMVKSIISKARKDEDYAKLFSLYRDVVNDEVSMVTLLDIAFAYTLIGFVDLVMRLLIDLLQVSSSDQRHSELLPVLQQNFNVILKGEQHETYLFYKEINEKLNYKELHSWEYKVDLTWETYLSDVLDAALKYLN